jgi:hypothetical protein
VNLYKDSNEEECNLKTLEQVCAGEITVKTVVEMRQLIDICGEKNYWQI